MIEQTTRDRVKAFREGKREAKREIAKRLALETALGEWDARSHHRWFAGRTGWGLLASGEGEDVAIVRLDLQPYGETTVRVRMARPNDDQEVVDATRAAIEAIAAVPGVRTLLVRDIL